MVRRYQQGKSSRDLPCLYFCTSRFFLRREMKEYGNRIKGTMLDKDAMRRTLARIAHEIVEKNDDLSNVVLVGIKTRGVPIAYRIRDFISAFEGISLEVDTLDISEFRDDIVSGNIPQIPNFTFDVVGKDIILIDDVLFTGRSARAGMEALIRSGRPRSIQLAVLVDRGHRELPIRADYVGKNIPTSRNEEIKVLLDETDGEDIILILNKKQ